MAWKKYFGLVTSAALVGVVAMANGCSSSSTKAGPSDSGTASDSPVKHDSGSSSGSSSGGGDDSGDGSSAGTYDGTTGKACASDTDCHPPGGPGVNKCTSSGIFTGGNLYPTAICLDIQNCDPGTDGNLHFCDGPDMPSSPGVCLQGAAAGKGICLPQCAFKPDGSAVTGCQGKDACFAAGFQQDPNNANAAVGIGYCFGGCSSDADCGTEKCQIDSGLCLKALTTDPAVGTGCNSNSTPPPTCNCIAASTSGLGYCAQFCKTGGTACPSGQVCDANLPLALTSSTDASIAGWTSANPGMGGFCAPTCVVDGGTTGDAGGCFTNSTCQAGNLGGPDCLP